MRPGNGLWEVKFKCMLRRQYRRQKKCPLEVILGTPVGGYDNDVTKDFLLK